MTELVNHQFRLARRPVGMVQRSDFEYVAALQDKRSTVERHDRLDARVR